MSFDRIKDRVAGSAGAHAMDVYPDGVEVVGSTGDSDDSAGFVAGTFDPQAVADAFPAFTVTDCRTDPMGVHVPAVAS